MPYSTLNDWIAQETTAFDPASPESFNAAIDRLISTHPMLEVLGLGEPTHGVEAFLLLRNQLFARLVEAHGFRAIAIESSFPRARIIYDYINGDAAASIDHALETGTSHGFGKSPANRALVEWMRQYNAAPAHQRKLRFYGFDAPTEMMYADSPRQLLHFALDYLASIDGENSTRRGRIDELIGNDADWENQAVAFDPSKGVGLSAAAAALRLETEELITELQIRRPELESKSEPHACKDALHHACLARQMLTYHAGMARASEDRIARLLGMRDVMMADNLVHIMSRELGLGKVLAFAHNSHLQRGLARWQLAGQNLAWWPAGAHLNHAITAFYAVIGCFAGVDESIGLPPPNAATLEAKLLSSAGPARLIPTHLGAGLPTSQVESLPTRTTTNPAYFPLSRQSVTDFDWLMMLTSL